MKSIFLKDLLSKTASNNIGAKSLNQKKRRSVSKSRLPHPLTFYQQFGINLKGRKEWEKAICPFHDDKNASLGINTIHGGFKCHACQKSGDMIGFYMQINNVDFKTTCTKLELWEDC